MALATFGRVPRNSCDAGRWRNGNGLLVGSFTLKTEQGGRIRFYKTRRAFEVSFFWGGHRDMGYQTLQFFNRFRVATNSLEITLNRRLVSSSSAGTGRHLARRAHKTFAGRHQQRRALASFLRPRPLSKSIVQFVVLAYWLLTQFKKPGSAMRNPVPKARDQKVADRLLNR